jgi:hypothetical protein
MIGHFRFNGQEDDYYSKFTLNGFVIHLPRFLGGWGISLCKTHHAAPERGPILTLSEKLSIILLAKSQKRIDCALRRRYRWSGDQTEKDF